MKLSGSLTGLTRSNSALQQSTSVMSHQAYSRQGLLLLTSPQAHFGSAALTCLSHSQCKYTSAIIATLLQNEQLGYWSTLWVMLLDIYVVLTGPEKRAVRMALWLAFFDQGCASTAIINYAPEVLEIAGVKDYGDATLWSSAITAAKVRSSCDTLKSPEEVDKRHLGQAPFKL